MKRAAAPKVFNPEPPHGLVRNYKRGPRAYPPGTIFIAGDRNKPLEARRRIPGPR